MTSGDTIDVADLPETVRSNTGGAGGLASPRPMGESDAAKAGTLREFKENAERTFLVGKLRENGWNISKTAEVIAVVNATDLRPIDRPSGVA